MSEFIITYTGKKVFPLDIKPDDICLEDIAHALANKCRFTGHCRYFYSVAQHSLLAARELKNLIKQPLWGLFHDAGEAYLPDVATGLKNRFPDLQIAEIKILKAVGEKFHLIKPSLEDKQKIKMVDKFTLFWEGKLLMPFHQETMWSQPDKYCNRLVFDPISPNVAEQEFLKYANGLFNRA